MNGDWIMDLLEKKYGFLETALQRVWVSSCAEARFSDGIKEKQPIWEKLEIMEFQRLVLRDSKD